MRIRRNRPAVIIVCMIRPKNPTDLTLAPVAAAVDFYLQEIRDVSVDVIGGAVALALNSDPADSRDGRAHQILEVAVRLVDLHGWSAAISDDSTRLLLRGGSVPLDIGLSAAIRDYIEG
jgi:hypothetical protein